MPVKQNTFHRKTFSCVTMYLYHVFDHSLLHARQTFSHKHHKCILLHASPQSFFGHNKLHYLYVCLQGVK